MQDGSPNHTSNQLSPGTRLNGIYEIDHLIAAGGMGEVYKGHTVQTGDAVAIKVLHPEYARNDAALGLFRREASALHNLQHEAIVRYYVFTIEPTLGRPYLAMEFVEGQSLADLVRREPLTYEAVRSLLQARRRRSARGARARHRPPRRLYRQHHDSGRRRGSSQDHRFRYCALDAVERPDHHRERLCRQVQLCFAGTARAVRR